MMVSEWPLGQSLDMWKIWDQWAGLWLLCVGATGAPHTSPQRQTWTQKKANVRFEERKNFACTGGREVWHSKVPLHTLQCRSSSVKWNASGSAQAWDRRSTAKRPSLWCWNPARVFWKPRGQSYAKLLLSGKEDLVTNKPVVFRNKSKRKELRYGTYPDPDDDLSSNMEQCGTWLV